MEYIMVPVPAEHVAEVEQYLRWNTVKLQLNVWEHDDIVAYLGRLDDRSRTLLLHAAECADETRLLPVADAASVVGCTERELLGTMMELNESARSAGGPGFVLATELLADTTETGARAWKLSMPAEVATIFLKASGRGVANTPGVEPLE